jgi:tetratricopeptide (TPR) repeat protein
MTATPESSGAIGFLTLPSLYRDLFARMATGQLVAYRGETIKKIFFKNGFVLYATSNLTADRLGDVLLARGVITRDQFDESTRQVLATGRKQGTLLVQAGALAPQGLFQGLIAQVREIVVSLCSWDGGSWRFLEGLPSQEEIVSLRLHPASLIFEGLTLLAADPRWSAAWDPQQLELRPAANAPIDLAQIDAPETARRLFPLVGQGHSPQELARLIGRSAGETATLLYGLALFGLVEARPRPAAQPAAAQQQPAPATAPATAEPATRDDAEIRSLREKVSIQTAQFASLSLYQILGVTPKSEPDTIKRSYIALAKEYHPDRFFRAEFADLQEAVNSIFMRISQAYSTLSNPAARAEYDREILQVTTPVARVKAPLDDSHIAREQFTKGLALLNTGDVWSGIEALRWAVNLAPQNPRYHTWLGVALMRSKKRLREAEEHCKAAIALENNNAQFHVHLGQVYRTGRLFDKARHQFETALRLDPKNPVALKETRELEPPPETGRLGRFLGK